MATANGTLHRRESTPVDETATTGWPVVDSQSEFSMRKMKIRCGKQSEMVIAANCLISRFGVHAKT